MINYIVGIYLLCGLMFMLIYRKIVITAASEFLQGITFLLYLMSIPLVWPYLLKEARKHYLKRTRKENDR